MCRRRRRGQQPNKARFPVAIVDSEKCTACGACEEFCPAEAIIVSYVANVDMTKCAGCSLCVASCAQGAIGMIKMVKPRTFTNRRGINYLRRRNEL